MEHGERSQEAFEVKRGSNLVKEIHLKGKGERKEKEAEGDGGRGKWKCTETKSVGREAEVFLELGLKRRRDSTSFASFAALRQAFIRRRGDGFVSIHRNHFAIRG